MYKGTFICLLLIGTFGCSNVSSVNDGKTSYAYQAADRDSVAFDEIVTGVPFDDKGGAFANIHIALTAILNTSGNEQTNNLSTLDDVRRIVNSSSPRISAALVKYMQNRSDFLNTKQLVNELTKTAESTFNPIYSKWKHAEKYKVEFVITSLYFTDGSVGRTKTERTMWW